MMMMIMIMIMMMMMVMTLKSMIEFVNDDIDSGDITTIHPLNYLVAY